MLTLNQPRFEHILTIDNTAQPKPPRFNRRKTLQETETMNANYLETVAAADRLTIDAAYLAGQLEAAHMAAAGRWACAMLDATAAGMAVSRVRREVVMDVRWQEWVGARQAPRPPAPMAGPQGYGPSLQHLATVRFRACAEPVGCCLYGSISQKGKPSAVA